MAKKPSPKQVETRKRTGPVEFVEQTRREVARVTWPTRKETLVTTMMVFLMVTIMSLFFMGVDFVISSVVRLLLSGG